MCTGGRGVREKVREGERGKGTEGEGKRERRGGGRG